MKNRPDPIILFIIILLILIGIISVFSSSNLYAERATGNSLYFFNKHLLTLIPGLICFLIGFYANPDLFLKNSKIFLFLSVFLLILVLIPGIGKKVSGARRWISLGFIKMQPSSIAKISIIFYLAAVLPGKENKLKIFSQGMLPPLIIVGILAMLIVLEPDISTAGGMVILSFFMFYIAGIPLLHISTIMISIFPLFIILLEIKPYIASRLLILNPYADPYNKGYHLLQSFRAIQAGGIFGVGPGNSIQKTSHLPEAHTDFIFAIISEETGLIGAFIIILLFSAFLVRGIQIVRRTSNINHSLLACGITLAIAFQALLHILVVIGLVPTTGLPLPFISYGRTSLIINLLMAGILTGISRKISGEKLL